MFIVTAYIAYIVYTLCFFVFFLCVLIFAYIGQCRLPPVAPGGWGQSSRFYGFFPGSLCAKVSCLLSFSRKNKSNQIK